jgi:hypothetical protein
VSKWSIETSKAYKVWWASLRPEERRTLVASGAFRADDPQDTTPANDRTRVNDGHSPFDHQDGWLAYGPTNRHRDSIASPSDVLQQVIANEETDDQGMSHARADLDLATFRLRATLTFLLSALDKSTDSAMRLHADIIRIVVGEGNPPRMTELAQRHGITRAAVSLRCRRLLRQLGLEPSIFMRPESHVVSMRFSRIVSHATGQPCSIGGKRRKSALFGDLATPTPPPSKESPRKAGVFPTRARPRQNGAK